MRNAFAIDPLEQRTLLSAPVSAVGDHSPAAPASSLVYAPHSTVKGKTIGEWTTDWWKWALSFSAPNDPFSDPSGAKAGLHQKGPVFFVGAPVNNVAHGSFDVPGDKPILVSIVDGELSQLEIGFDKTAAQVAQAASDQIDAVDMSLFHAIIDGHAVSNLASYREVSPIFHFVAAPNNPIGVPQGHSGIAVADGYFIMLKPLGPGHHVLSFGGTVPAFGTFVIDANYVIPRQGGGGGACDNSNVADSGHHKNNDVWDDN